MPSGTRRGAILAGARRQWMAVNGFRVVLDMTLSSIRPAEARGPAAAGPVHPVWLRVSHWLNALAALLMMLSGWRIYDASPVFPGLTFPPSWTLGGWLGGALQWHFAAMWLLMLNGIVYLAANLVSRRFPARFLPLSPRAVLHDLRAALRGRLSHDDPRHYNAVQKFAYLAVVLDLIVLVLSGLAIWKSVQFPLLRDLFGGYDNARVVHFCAMAVMAAFLVVHVAMVALVPRSLLTMLRGR
ncbi:cytochrome B [Burkholderia glumae AU6208]|nr:cytochrome B [Burkholderia glumae AU6208]QHE11456.1 cytochrome B [Burkholderia glumae AU6208]